MVISLSTRALVPREQPSSPASQQPSLYLGDLLRTSLEGARGQPRREVTRQRLLIAATDIIQEGGFSSLTVAAVCKAAGFAHGTFYLHWVDRWDIARQVITELMDSIRQHRPRSTAGAGLFERLMAGHQYYIGSYRQNVGLMSCQGELADQSPDFATIGTAANLALAHRIVRAVDREAGVTVETDVEQLARALSCIAMVDKLLHDIFRRGLDLGLSEEDLAQNISTTWFRALLGRDPP